LAFTNGATGGGESCELFRIDAQVGISRLPAKTGAGASVAGAVAMDAGCVARGACPVLMGAKTESSEVIIELNVKCFCWYKRDFLLSTRYVYLPFLN